MIADADDFSRAIQELSTEYCWGAIWTRPVLSLRDRSLLNLGMIGALNRQHEMKLHIHTVLPLAVGDEVWVGSFTGGRLARFQADR